VRKHGKFDKREKNQERILKIKSCACQSEGMFCNLEITISLTPSILLNYHTPNTPAYLTLALIIGVLGGYYTMEIGILKVRDSIQKQKGKMRET